MSQPNKDNRPEAVLDRVLEKTGVMSQPKSNEDLIEGVKKTIYPADEDYERGMKIGFNDGLYKAQGIFEKALAQKDAEVAKIRMEAEEMLERGGWSNGQEEQIRDLFTPKSKEDLVKELANEIHSAFASAYAIKESVSHEWLKNIISKALAQKELLESKN